MSLAKRYFPAEVEPSLSSLWVESGTYDFDPHSRSPVYAIDTPPPSVSGNLHLGHVYSYAHADFFARFRRMRGDNVFYPMGYDDNGLPTERLVERERSVRADEIGRRAFIRECLAVSEAIQRQYEALWRRVGLSVDWRYTYRTIDTESRRIAQWAFLDLLRQGLAYRRQAPTVWCPECGTAIAQAEVNDLEREATYYTLAFELEGHGPIPIATTRPELLPACVAVFVHPRDERYDHLVGLQATVPLIGRSVPILADTGADPAKGTGAVMCCTFGDTADVAWWRAHNLPLIEVIGKDGRMAETAGRYAGMSVGEARRSLIEDLSATGAALTERHLPQTVRVHERCDTPVEFITSMQWFIRLLDHRDVFLQAGEQINWYPRSMQARYLQWVENLNLDWCISRQRTFGVPFPLWYCRGCGEPVLPDEADLPVDPLEHTPKHACACGCADVMPETDVMDTWATSSLSPQIVGRRLADAALFRQVYPMSLRPQAHEIIRTWAFYTIVRAIYHTGQLPWRDIAISGWGLAAGGEEKLSKSRGGSATGPQEVMDQYSADAVRYWAAGTALGKDAAINMERIQAGAKLVNKLWNIARFSERFIESYQLPKDLPEDLSTADRWILARVNQLITQITSSFENYDYAGAKNEIENFFWRDLADNYLEMVKKRLYDGEAGFEAARFTLYAVLLNTLKLLAPILPFVTETIYRELFAAAVGTASIHRASWPEAIPLADQEESLAAGDALLYIATTVRRFKSERNLSPGAELADLQISAADPALRDRMQKALPDLLSITRARAITIVSAPEKSGKTVTVEVSL